MIQELGEIKAFRDRNLLLRGADIATQKGWTGVPKFILESDRISVGAKLTYAMLLKYAREMDECYHGQECLAKDIVTTDRSVQTRLKELAQENLIEMKHRGQGGPSLYIVHKKVEFWRKTK